MHPLPDTHDLVLIGGGHSHALALRMWGMRPLQGIRVTLISPLPDTPYSGMLPGLIAGNYAFDETHIDLARLCRFANARFIRGAVTAVDLDAQRIQVDGRPDIGFDLLSINSGIQPSLDVPGAAEFAVPVKPIATFYQRFCTLRQTLRQAVPGTPSHRIAVVGGGAAAVELACSLFTATHDDADIAVKPRLDIYHPGDALPEGYPKRLQRLTQQRLDQLGIAAHGAHRVVAVQAGQLIFDNDAEQQRADFDTVIWATSAAASRWPAESALSVDNGFIVVDDCLRSVSHGNVFAAGDIAVQQNHPRPRAGVFAVRQANTLFENWQRTFTKQPLRRFKPQRAYLSLLAFGHDYAAGCRRHSMLPVVAGRWVWRWKDHIDRKFMAQFKSLPMNMATPAANTALNDSDRATMHCGGCGAKVGADILERVLAQLATTHDKNVVAGIEQRDDASVLRMPEAHLLVQSVDQFRALIDDPWLLGRICANHALSDLFAMFARPHSAQALITLPWADDVLLERDLLQIMLGAQAVFASSGCTIVGGHSAQGAELSVGFAVNGVIRDDFQQPSIGLGDAVIVTKALGTGTLFAAHELGRANGRDLGAAIDSMLQSNHAAAEILQRCGATACTDVTGFGLGGHLHRLLSNGAQDAQINLSKIPTLPGATASAESGDLSSLQPQNLRFAAQFDGPTPVRATPHWQLLFDPQTSGGLLATIPSAAVDDCVKGLIDAGYRDSREIGRVTGSGSGRIAIAW